jgi:uncharacterized membrane protein
VITLLVLEVHVPDLGAGQRLVDALHEIRPSFVAFLISFVVVAIAWTGHRDLFVHIRLTDRNVVWLNLLYLFPLCLLPFGAALISRHPRDGVAISIYGTQLLAIAVTRLLIWLYATKRPHLLYEPIDRRSRRLGVLVVAVPGALYLLAIVIADRAPLVSIWIFAGAPILYFATLILSRAQAPPSAAERDFT